MASRVYEFNGQLHFVDRSARGILEHHWQGRGQDWLYNKQDFASAEGRVTALSWAAANQVHADRADPRRPDRRRVPGQALSVWPTARTTI